VPAGINNRAANNATLNNPPIRPLTINIESSAVSEPAHLFRGEAVLSEAYT
jgi:hypothetical protein